MPKRRPLRSFVPPSWRYGLMAGFMRLVRLFYGDFAKVRANNYSLIISTRDIIQGAKLFVSGRLEPDETIAFRKLTRNGDRVIDIGANIGYFTVLLALLVGEGGRVLAVEPDPESAALLRKNVDLNKLHGVVTVVEAAAGEAPGEGTLGRSADYNAGDNRMHRTREDSPFRGSAERDSVDVRVVTIDECIRDWDRVDIIKMDAQGYEPLILRGMLGTLSRNEGVVILTEFWPRGMENMKESAEGFCRALNEMGFSMWEFQDNGKLDQVHASDLLARLAGPKDFTNLVCVRPKGRARLVESGLIA